MLFTPVWRVGLKPNHHWTHLINPQSKADLELQWIHRIWICSLISFNKTWINPILETRIYNVASFPGMNFQWLDSWWYNLWHFCKSQIPKMRETDPIYSRKHRGTLSPLSVRGSNLEQESACASCLEVGIQVLHSFSEVTTPILYIIYTIYLQYLNLKRTDSVLNSDTDMAIFSGSWDRLMSYFWSESVRKGWWWWKTVRKQNKSSLNFFSSHLLWVRGWLLARSIKVYIPFKTRLF